MTVSGSWVEAVVAAGAVPASHVPAASLGRSDVEEFTGADPVEAAELHTYPLGDAPSLAPGAVCFLDGIEQWRVVGYGGITPIVRAHAAAAIRRRGPDRRLHTVAEATEAVAIPRPDSLPAPVRRAREAADVGEVPCPLGGEGPPSGGRAPAAPIAAWARAQRAPIAPPDRRWDRLLYPTHDVETYLRARAPSDLTPHPTSRIPYPGSRLPRTAS